MTLKEIRGTRSAATKAEAAGGFAELRRPTEEQRAEVATLEDSAERRGSGAGIVPEVGRAATASPGSAIDRDVDGAGPSAAYEGKRPGSRSGGQGARGSRSDSGVRRRHAEQP